MKPVCSVLSVRFMRTRARFVDARVARHCRPDAARSGAAGWWRPQEAELKRLVSELGIADRVVFAGRVPHGEVQRYYDLIDLLVYPRLSMRLTELVTPLKPLEAMAQGRLLVASDVGGHRELIRDGETGVLFKAGDPDALAAAVVGLLREPQRWPAMKDAGRRFVENERNWAASVAHYRPVYDALLGSSKWN
jgi:glycosyltransferase involved in cell wall biosynthesis